MPTALEKLRNELDSSSNQDIPLESIKDILNDLLNNVEAESMNTVIGREMLIGNVVSVPPGGPVELTWDVSQGPDSLLDLTNPAEPAVIETGLYIVTAEVSCVTLPNGKSFQADLGLDWNSPSLTPDIACTSAPASAGFANPLVNLSGAWYLSAGGVIVIAVQHDDIGSHNCRFSPAIVIKVPATIF